VKNHQENIADYFCSEINSNLSLHISVAIWRALICVRPFQPQLRGSGMKQRHCDELRLRASGMKHKYCNCFSQIARQGTERQDGSLETYLWMGT